MTNRLLLRKAGRDLRRRRSQIAAVAITVFLGIGLFAANYDAAANLDASYRELYDRLDFADVWGVGGPVDEIVAELTADPDVVAVSTRTRFDAPITIGDRQLVGTVIGMPTDVPAALNRLYLLDGRDFLPADRSADVAIVEQHGQKEFDLVPGDGVAVRGADGWRQLELVGSAASAEYVWLAPSRQQIFTVPDEFAVVFVPEPLARALAPGAPTQLTVGVADHDPAAAVRVADAVRAGGASDVYTRAEQASNNALQSDVTGFQQLSFLFPVLFLSVAGMAAFVLLSRMVRTERPQIGMMVANGVSVHTVRWHYTTHAFVAVFLGAVPGLAVGALIGRWISGLYTGFLDIPITVIRFSPATILWSLAFSVGVTLLAGGLPARAAARIEPAEAMRPPAPRSVTKRSVVERIWPRPLPQWVRMVVRNVTRSPRRFLSTVLGVVLALVLLITSLGMADTVFAVFDRQFGEVDKRDLTVTFDHAVGAADLAALEARAEVADAERFAQAPVVLAANGATSDQLLQAFESDTVAHGFDAPLPADGVVISDLARRELGVQVGDAIEIVVSTFGGSQAPVATARIPTTVAGVVDEPIPSVSYASIDAWDRLGAPATTVAVVTLTDGDAHQAVRDSLQAEPGVVAVVDQRAMVDTLRQLMGLTYLFIGLMVVFALIMAIALVYNMVSVSLAERTGEVATLQANGVGGRFVRRTVTAENLLTVGAGVVPGAVLGWLMARAFLTQFETESFTFDFLLTNRSLLLSIGLVLAAALLAQWPGLRALNRLDLAAVVRERSE